MTYYEENYRAEPTNDREDAFRRHMTKTYALMTGGLALTFIAALLTVMFLPGLILNTGLAIILLLAEVVTVIAFSALLHRASYGAVVGMYLFYALLTGISISYIFVLYDMKMVFLCFAATAISFAIMAIMGHTTKRDLTGLGRIFLPALIGLLLLSVVGFFMRSSLLEIIISSIGLILFLGITAYDTQRMHRLFESGGDETMLRKFAVYSALQLYLDFINIFMYILRLFGRTSRN